MNCAIQTNQTYLVLPDLHGMHHMQFLLKTNQFPTNIVAYTEVVTCMQLKKYWQLNRTLKKTSERFWLITLLHFCFSHSALTHSLLLLGFLSTPNSRYIMWMNCAIETNKTCLAMSCQKGPGKHSVLMQSRGLQTGSWISEEPHGHDEVR